MLREVLRDYPDNPDAAYSLGLLLVEMGRPEEGLGRLDAAAAGMPNNLRVHYNRGLLLQQLGRVDDAERALYRAMQIEPDNLDVLYALADHYLKRGKLYDLAFEDFSELPLERCSGDCHCKETP